MTGLYRNYGGDWIPVGDGSLLFRNSVPDRYRPLVPSNPTTPPTSTLPTRPSFTSPRKVYVRGIFGPGDGTGVPAWIDTGYKWALARPGTPLLRVVTESSPGAMTVLGVTWADSSQGVAPTEYWVTLYDAAGTPVQRKSVLYVERPVVSNAPFNNSVEFALEFAFDTNYYVDVSSVRTGFTNVKSAPTKFRTGHPAVTGSQAVYGWGAETSTHPTLVATTSQQDSAHSGDSAVDSSVDLTALFSSWVSDYHTASTSSSKPHTFWEGMSFAVPTSAGKLTKVQVIADPAQTLYLGINKNGTWVDSITPASAGIATTGYRNAGYGEILNHAQAAVHNDHNTNIKVFDVSPRALEFKDISQITLAITDLVPLGSIGGSAGTPVVKVISPAVPSVNIPANAQIQVFNAQYHNPHVQFWNPTTGAYVADSTGNLVAPLIAYIPGYRPQAISSTTVKWYSIGGGIAAISSSGNETAITLSMLRAWLNKAGSAAVTSTTYVGGSPPTPVWRARVQDVTLFYQPYTIIRYDTVTVTPSVSVEIGPDAW